MYKKFIAILCVLALLVPLLLPGLTAFADTPSQPVKEVILDIDTDRDYDKRNSLTDIYRDNSMKGNDLWLKRFAFIAFATQIIVTFVGLASNAQIMARTLLTVFYLSNRNFWDLVHTVHTEGLSASPPSWTDKIVWAVLWVFPDFKEYSDYGGSSGNLNLTDEDDLLQYILKIAPKTLIIITISTMAYNGTYARIYAEGADALDVLGNASTELNLVEKVQYLTTRADDYQFILKGSTSEMNQFIYDQVQRKPYRQLTKGIADANILDKVGASIEIQAQDAIQYRSLPGQSGVAYSLYVRSTGSPQVLIYQANEDGGMPSSNANNPFNLVDLNQDGRLTEDELVSQLKTTIIETRTVPQYYSTGDPNWGGALFAQGVDGRYVTLTIQIESASAAQ